jgi:hypothetical protein
MIGRSSTPQGGERKERNGKECGSKEFPKLTQIPVSRIMPPNKFVPLIAVKELYC